MESQSVRQELILFSNIIAVLLPGVYTKHGAACAVPVPVLAWRCLGGCAVLKPGQGWTSPRVTVTSVLEVSGPCCAPRHWMRVGISIHSMQVWADRRGWRKQINVTATVTALFFRSGDSFAASCTFKELCVIISRNPQIRSSTLHGAAPMGNVARSSQFCLTSY